MKKYLFVLSVALLMTFAVGVYIANANNTSATFPGTGANNNTYIGGCGTGNQWVNPSRITANDSSSATMPGCANTDGNYIQASNFGFSIPTNATILGIVLLVNRASVLPDSPNGDDCTDSRVRLVNSSGTILTTDKAVKPPATGAHWPAAFTSVSYGSPTDLWSAAWAPSDINNSNFGAVLAAFFQSPDGTGSGCAIDYMTITIYYGLPHGPAAQVTQSAGTVIQMRGTVIQQ